MTPTQRVEVFRIWQGQSKGFHLSDRQPAVRRWRSFCCAWRAFPNHGAALTGQTGL
ncbi:hypothetical protein Ga0080574_TMP3878 [Salipiger abyssi]|uniref:Uncharacterized protein n=1 Tax=Salipiger abyssi TaxID=1250539 RepID=A0A1P8UXU0_9RHOB|nr:hypothetical protein Ga0080574_TMP3878 [Salipiger abyssi]